jgi:hypothetical protein
MARQTSAGRKSQRGFSPREGAFALWQARVNRNWRFYFTIEGGEYLLRDIRPHRK